MKKKWNSHKCKEKQNNLLKIDGITVEIKNKKEKTLTHSFVGGYSSI